jgi:excisionase family DNA binding protein
MLSERPGMPKLKTPSRPAPPAGPNRAERRGYVKIGEAAAYLNCTTRTVYQMIADGRLTAYRSGARLIRLRIDEIDAAMQPYGGAV